MEHHRAGWGVVGLEEDALLRRLRLRLRLHRAHIVRTGRPLVGVRGGGGDLPLPPLAALRLHGRPTQSDHQRLPARGHQLGQLLVGFEDAHPIDLDKLVIDLDSREIARPAFEDLRHDELVVKAHTQAAVGGQVDRETKEGVALGQRRCGREGHRHMAR